MKEAEMIGNTQNAGFKWHVDGWFLFAVALLLAVVFPVVTYQYLYHDDWQWFGGRCPGHWFYLLGRPLGNALLCTQFHTFSHIGDAYIARMETVGVVILLMLAIHRFLRDEGLPPQLTVLIAFGVALLPGTVVIMYWLGAAYIVFSLLFSVGAARLCQKALRRDHQDKKFYLLLGGAWVAELASAYVYQLGAMMFLVLYAAALTCLAYARSPAFLRTLVTYGAVFASANMVYFGWFKYFVVEKLAQADPTRGTLFHDLAGELGWFAHQELPRAMQLWFPSPSANGIELAVGLLFAATFAGFAYFLFRRGSPGQGAVPVATYGVVVLLLGIASFLPLTLSNFRMPLFRPLIPLSAFVVTITSIQLYFLASGLRQAVPKLGYLVAAPMVGIAFVTHAMLRDQMVVPRSAEVQQIRKTMQQAKLGGHALEPVHLIVPAKENPWDTDEIGTLTTSYPDDDTEIIKHIRNEIGLPRVKVTRSVVGEQFDAKGKVVVDLSALQYW